ncbi:Trm112 family protein [Gilvimarinus sp. F26214L]|uniref:Trm112 family protein n=1 Tax=Gilvimarinus sp. DZF01 TaxID=3461371 RepID=UPI0040458763
MIDKKLLSILVCPVSKAPLEYDREKQELICWSSNLVYPIRDGIPVMMESEARQITEAEREAHRQRQKRVQQ